MLVPLADFVAVAIPLDNFKKVFINSGQKTAFVFLKTRLQLVFNFVRNIYITSSLNDTYKGPCYFS